MHPVLSIVVPVYNVRPYLEECLASLQNQSLTDVEIIVVDDGSTDGSAELAHSISADDPRIRVLEVSHGGLGRARNLGVAASSPTPYLAFADSDDIVTPEAYVKPIDLLERSGSDFATGNVQRLVDGAVSQAWQYAGFLGTRVGTHITDDMSLLTDRVAWNKIFRRSFWDRRRLMFPEGMLYEDSPLTIPAHFLAGSVDVVHEHVYIWRVRGGSISQRLTEVRGVADRIAGCAHVSGFLATAENGRWAAYKDRYDRSVLTDDLLDFLRVVPDGGDAFQECFVDRAAHLVESFAPDVVAGLPDALRRQWTLVRERRLPELLRSIAHEGVPSQAPEGSAR
ncbi:glycosyltransferase family 2 protein [Streptomyces sp. NPDC020472]|uniref:glycosyltransferase family 2 protein n=1 Tax=Streptomyces sp. NPDC020472 TaxID=3365075 RepID=UPI00379282DE